MGIEPYSQAEFDARNTDELKNPPKTYAVRDYGKPDADGHGTLTGINQYSQEEFDARTKEQ